MYIISANHPIKSPGFVTLETLLAVTNTCYSISKEDADF